MPYALVRGLRLYYEQAGAGPDLVFISGTGSDLRVRPNVLDGPFARAFRVLTWDQRGLGRSDKPDEPYSMADYALDAAALMEAVGIDKAAVIGVSFGGMVAQELALRSPEKITRLVLACTSPGGAGGASYPLHELQDLPHEERARRVIPLGDTRRDETWARDNPDAYAQALAATADPFAGEPGRREGARRQLQARMAHDTWDRLPAIRIPTLIAAGRYDGIALPETQERMAARIPGAKLRFFEGGHLFMLQDRSAPAEMIAFLQDPSRS